MIVFVVCLGNDQRLICGSKDMADKAVKRLGPDAFCLAYFVVNTDSDLDFVLHTHPEVDDD